jgi:NADH dehydrogenase
MLQGDATDPAALAAACAGCAAVVSAVAIRRDHRPQTFLQVNVEGPRLLGEAAKAAGVNKVVLVSEIGAQPNSKLKYLASRWAGEQALQRSGVPCTILRFSFILGAEGGLAKEFAKLANFGPMLILPDGGRQHFQPIVLEDAARCVVASLSRVDLYGKTLELGGPEVLTYEQLFDFFVRARGITKPKVRVPVSVLVPGAALLETFMRDPMITSEELRTMSVESIAAAIDVVKANFGFQPISPSVWAQSQWRLPQSA